MNEPASKKNDDGAHVSPPSTPVTSSNHPNKDEKEFSPFYSTLRSKINAKEPPTAAQRYRHNGAVDYVSSVWSKENEAFESLEKAAVIGLGGFVIGSLLQLSEVLKPVPSSHPSSAASLSSSVSVPAAGQSNYVCSFTVCVVLSFDSVL
jgi:hypothetical protein